MAVQDSILRRLAVDRVRAIQTAQDRYKSSDKKGRPTHWGRVSRDMSMLGAAAVDNFFVVDAAIANAVLGILFARLTTLAMRPS